jgi:multiple sugar transport system substrate-binding protein
MATYRAQTKPNILRRYTLMKKLLALLLSLTLLLAGTAALAAGMTVTLGVYPDDTDPNAQATHNTYYIPALQALYPDLTIIPASYTYALETFPALAESGKIPTVFETWYTEPQKLIKNGQVADITDELAALGWLDKINPSVRALLSDSAGKVYGIPRDGYALGLMINAEVFAEAGLVDADGIPLYPKTWDEVIAASVKIKEATGSAGLCLLAQDNAGGWHFSNIAWTFGADFEAQDANGKWVAQINTPQVKAAYDMIYSMKWTYDILTSDPTSENWGSGFA